MENRAEAVGQENLGDAVVALSDGGRIMALGRIVGYCEEPTVIIRLGNGEEVRWKARLCKVVAQGAMDGTLARQDGDDNSNDVDG